MVFLLVSGCPFVVSGAGLLTSGSIDDPSPFCRSPSGVRVGVGCPPLWWGVWVAHCWGSEESGPLAGPGRVSGSGGGVGCSVAWQVAWSPVGGGVSGRGVLFEICIVDASIFVGKVCVFVRPHWWRSLLLFGGGVSVGVGVVASCEGHMVDALASRADEGRRSLR